jgi:hypothetical protein
MTGGGSFGASLKDLAELNEDQQVSIWVCMSLILQMCVYSGGGGNAAVRAL